MPVIPLSDASRRPTRFPAVTASVIAVNALVFLVELLGGDAFVTRWSVIPADSVAGHHWITILTAMFCTAASRCLGSSPRHFSDKPFERRFAESQLVN